MREKVRRLERRTFFVVYACIVRILGNKIDSNSNMIIFLIAVPNICM